MQRGSGDGTLGKTTAQHGRPTAEGGANVGLPQRRLVVGVGGAGSTGEAGGGKRPWFWCASEADEGTGDWREPNNPGNAPESTGEAIRQGQGRAALSVLQHFQNWCREPVRARLKSCRKCRAFTRL